MWPSRRLAVRLGEPYRGDAVKPADTVEDFPVAWKELLKTKPVESTSGDAPLEQTKLSTQTTLEKLRKKFIEDATAYKSDRAVSPSNHRMDNDAQNVPKVIQNLKRGETWNKWIQGNLVKGTQDDNREITINLLRYMFQAIQDHLPVMIRVQSIAGQHQMYHPLIVWYIRQAPIRRVCLTFGITTKEGKVDWQSFFTVSDGASKDELTSWLNRNMPSATVPEPIVRRFGNHKTAEKLGAAAEGLLLLMSSVGAVALDGMQPAASSQAASSSHPAAVHYIRDYGLNTIAELFEVYKRYLMTIPQASRMTRPELKTAWEADLRMVKFNQETESNILNLQDLLIWKPILSHSGSMVRTPSSKRKLAGSPGAQSVLPPPTTPLGSPEALLLLQEIKPPPDEDNEDDESVQRVVDFLKEVAMELNNAHL